MGKKSCDDSMVVTPSNNTLVNIGLTGIAIGVILNGIGISVTNEKLDDVFGLPYGAFQVGRSSLQPRDGAEPK